MRASSLFSERECKLICAAKKTLRILAKVMADRFPQGVAQDLDLTAMLVGADEIGNEAKSKFRQSVVELIEMEAGSAGPNADRLRCALAEALCLDLETETTDAALEPRVRSLQAELRGEVARLTPDLPTLNAREEAGIVGQLGMVIFTRLLADAESDDG